MKQRLQRGLFRYGYELVGTELVLHIFLTKAARNNWVEEKKKRYPASGSNLSAEDISDVFYFFEKLTGAI